MKKNIVLLSTIIFFLLSCGGPGTGGESSEVSYIQTVDDIRELTGNLTDPVNNNEARRYLSKIQKLMLPLESDKAKNDLRVIPVNVRTAGREYIASRVRYLGDIKGDPSIVVYPKLSDIITDIYVQNGDYVQKGDILARIDDAGVRDSKKQAEAGYRSAKSQLENVRSEYERTKALHEDNAISQSQWEQVVTQLEVAKAGLSQAEAALEMAKTQLSHTILRAPINGYVSGRAYDSGDMATPQKPFASIHDIKNVKIAINVTERDLGNIEEGQRAEMTVSAYPGEVFEGRITVISPVIDPMTRTGGVEITLENKNLRLKPGMFARVDVITDERHNALTIEKAAVTRQTVLQQTGDNLRDDRVIKTYSCFIVENGIAREKVLEIGIESKTEYEVLSGLKSGDKFVIMGQNNLSDSTMVEIVN